MERGSGKSCAKRSGELLKGRGVYDGVFFFFQAEDGIRDLTVTGVQTCALPILLDRVRLHAGVPDKLEDPQSVAIEHRHRPIQAIAGIALAELGNELDAVHAVHSDRKSTRLNSSHSQISYAVFCLKKKKI